MAVFDFRPKYEITSLTNHAFKLFDIAKQTRPHHAWLIEEIMLSQVSVYKDVCRLVEFRTERQT
jgi:hypothetical protein